MRTHYVRTHYVSTNDAYTVITRAMDIIRRTGRTITAGQPTGPEPARDLMTDVTTVLDWTVPDLVDTRS